MGSLFANKAADATNPQPPASSLRVQTSVEGKPIAVVYGMQRVAGNVIWYGDFVAIAINTPQSGGGGKGGGSSTTFSVSYVYRVSLAIGLCEGPIAEVPRAWATKSEGTPESMGFTPFLGTYAQTPWGYLTTNHPTEALAYRGLAYLAAESFQLGSNTELPNFSFEVRGTISNAVSGLSDADPKDVAIDLLTNAHYGAGFPSARVDPLMTQFSNYCRATGLLVSWVLQDQKEASGLLADMFAAVNSSPRWSSGVMTVVPWGDEDVTGNGVSYVADVTPLYDITDDDLLPNQGGAGEEPIQIVVRPRERMINSVNVEYLSRDADYDPVSVNAKDEASIVTYGLRTSDVQASHMLSLADAAVLSVNLRLNREQIECDYTFTLPPKFILPDVEDILTLTRDALGMLRVPVRITEITENEDGSFVFHAEDHLGTAGAPLYGSEASSGHTTNTNVDPGMVNAPLLFEPTAELLAGQTLQVWGAISGVDASVWGGAFVYVSTDGVNYKKQDGQVLGAARMGLLTAPLPTFTVNNTGLTIDTTSTLSVNLSESEGELLSGAQSDVLSLNTACYVGGEVVAYRDAALTSANHYDLTYLVRGAYGTESLIATHAVGTPFARLDQGIFRVPFDKTQIGTTIYIKLQSFNLWGGGLQDLDTIAPYAYAITGSALASPLATVANLTSKFVDGRLNISWDELTDFRADIRYEIRKGDTFDGGLTLGVVAHPPFAVPGDGTYWVSGWCQPTPALLVRSESAVSIGVTNAFLTINVAATFDCKAEGWPGVFTNTGVDSGLDAVRTAGAGNVLAETDVLSITDILNLGGEVSGTYRPTFIVDVGRVAPCAITITWRGTGVPQDADILGNPDVLAAPDVLGSASVAFVDVYPEVLISQESTGDVLAAADFLGITDVLTYGIPFATAIKYSPGTFVGRVFAFQFQLNTVDPQTIAYLLEAMITVDMPDRLDTTGLVAAVVTSLTNVTVPAGGLAITFVPNGDTAAAAFLGGPDGELGSLPHVQVTCGAQQAGDTLLLTGWTLAGVTVQWQNGGVGVSRDKNNISILGF